MRVGFNKSLKIGQENEFTQGVADADVEIAHIQRRHPPNLFLPGVNGLKSRPDMLIENPAFLRQRHTSGTSGKQRYPETFLKAADGLADGRLTVVKLLGRLRNIPCICYRVKNPIQR